MQVFDPAEVVPMTNLTKADMDTPAHRALALQSARESVVLLNNSARLLPLNRSALTRVAVVGPYANNTKVMAGDKADYVSSFTVTVLEGIQQFFPNAQYVLGCAPNTTDTSGIAAAVALASAADVTILVVGDDNTLEKEQLDRTSLELPGCQS